MQSLLKSPSVRTLGMGALVAGLVLVTSPGQTQSGGPFSDLAGKWTGGGTITINTGARERIRCQVTYSVSNGGHNLSQSLRCASDSYRFDLNSTVSHRGGTISGTFSETSRGVAGRLSGRVSGNSISAIAEGSGFSANLSVSTSGNRQSVSISSPGSEVSNVSISLRRG